jgi:hypothetical protein|tara:strand:- start:8924 stop:9058 length:135 start_codon:yes stop_codon:yes gene_type:complete
MQGHLCLRSQPRQPTGSGNKTPAKSRLSNEKNGKNASYLPFYNL